MPDRAGSIRKIAALLRDLDCGMLTTRDDTGALRARPMSNNGEVEFDGDVWFFSAADSRKVRDIAGDARVELTYADPSRWTFVAMSGRASIVRDRARKQELWLEELERWFDEGPESDAIVLIKVTPATVAWWNEEDSDEVALG